jgi:ariadne-1
MTWKVGNLEAQGRETNGRPSPTLYIPVFRVQSLLDNLIFSPAKHPQRNPLNSIPLAFPFTMDSEDDTYQSSGAEETPSDYYNSDEDYDYCNKMAAEDDDADDPREPEQNYEILTEPIIRRRQENEITKVSTVLAISKAAATVLLLHYDWRAPEVQDAWFADEERVRKSTGLIEKPVVQLPKNTRKLECRICLETRSVRVMRWAACGHPFCAECWGNYIKSSVQDGPGCLMLTCPAPSCGAAVRQDMVESLATSEEDKERYSRYLMRSYIENNKKSKWCPAPDCEYAVEFFGQGTRDYDVRCLCSTGFCWNCVEDAHRPVDCTTVAKWVLKNSSEAENVTWILAKTKPCPKCKRPIEKRDGCMHMTCGRPCRHEFCWLCLGSWDKHTSGQYDCNTYKNSSVMKEFDSTRERAKISLDRYNHYYERWAGNESSRKQAVKDLHETQTGSMEKLEELMGETCSRLDFITQAWLQIIECRRVLKWTYAYGYYLPEHEKLKKAFFEYLQGEAESGLENLHHSAENDMKEFLKEKTSAEKFNDFRIKLTRLTAVTRTYFENLVKALENGLEDVYSQEACSKVKAKEEEPRIEKTS